MKEVRVWNKRGKIRVKRACLLWQSPRPSVLPCSTSCSKADLQGTKTSWSAVEKQARPRRLDTPSLGTKLRGKKKAPPKIAYVGAQYKLQKVICWLEIKEHLGKVPWRPESVRIQPGSK